MTECLICWGDGMTIRVPCHCKGTATFYVHPECLEKNGKRFCPACKFKIDKKWYKRNVTDVLGEETIADLQPLPRRMLSYATNGAHNIFGARSPRSLMEIEEEIKKACLSIRSRLRSGDLRQFELAYEKQEEERMHEERRQREVEARERERERKLERERVRERELEREREQRRYADRLPAPNNSYHPIDFFAFVLLIGVYIAVFFGDRIAALANQKLTVCFMNSCYSMN